tara:strand:- start:151 stop:1011 length:861 start_codon:yes stop_codon:yes gene_type:complete
MNKAIMQLVAKLRRYFFYLRKGGIKGLVKFYQLNKFEENIFGKKKLKWDNLGYWKVDPMPSEDQLQKFYSEIYWLSNIYYKNNLLIPRDIDHLTFLQDKIKNKLSSKINFMNFGAGHGGISYLMASKNNHVVNIEPSEISAFNYENFSSYKNINEFLNKKVEFEKIDILYSSHTVEHLRKPLEFFKQILRVLKNDGVIFIEVPNCRKSFVNENYAEGGCDGKITGSHLIYFTKDFFENLDSEIFYYKEDNGGQKYTEVETENDADCIRAIIKAESLNNWFNKSNLK